MNFVIKTNIRLIILIILCISSVFAYLYYDSVSYEYGLGSNFSEKRLPFYLQPSYEMNYPQKFVLLDGEGDKSVGKGCRFFGSKLLINEIIGYGYNDSSIVIKATDSLNHIKYLVSYIHRVNNNNIPIIAFKDMDESDFQANKYKYTWTELDENIIEKIRSFTFVSSIGFFTTLFLLIRRLYKAVKSRTNNELS